MNEYCIFPELLYIISNYCKAKIVIKKTNSKKQTKELYESILILQHIVNLMKQKEKIQSNDIKPIIDYITKNKGVVFTCEMAEKAISILKYAEFDEHLNQKYTNLQLLILADKIIKECLCLLDNKSFDYMQKNWYLLMAFHNIPRTFIVGEGFALVNINPISIKEAQDFADSYLKIYNKKYSQTPFISN